MNWAGGDEIEETCSSVELSEEEGGVFLRLWVLDPLQTWPDTAILAAPFSQNPAPIAARPHGA